MSMIIIVFSILAASATSPAPVFQQTLVGSLVAEPPTFAERLEVETQITRCARRVEKHADPFLVLALLRYEYVLGVPDSHRGLLGAIWCWENGMLSVPKVGDNGRSHGSFQMQQWFWAWCRLPMSKRVTDDLFIAAGCFWSRVDHYLLDGKCPGNVTRAEAMAAHGPKYASAGCAAKSRHVQELERWRALDTRSELR